MVKVGLLGGTSGIEPETSRSTIWRSNQLSYVPTLIGYVLKTYVELFSSSRSSQTRSVTWSSGAGVCFRASMFFT